MPKKSWRDNYILNPLLTLPNWVKNPDINMKSGGVECVIFLQYRFKNDSGCLQEKHEYIGKFLGLGKGHAEPQALKATSDHIQGLPKKAGIKNSDIQLIMVQGYSPCDDTTDSSKGCRDRIKDFSEKYKGIKITIFSEESYISPYDEGPSPVFSVADGKIKCIGSWAAGSQLHELLGKYEDTLKPRIAAEKDPDHKKKLEKSFAYNTAQLKTFTAGKAKDHYVRVSNHQLKKDGMKKTEFVFFATLCSPDRAKEYKRSKSNTSSK